MASMHNASRPAGSRLIVERFEAAMCSRSLCSRAKCNSMVALLRSQCTYSERVYWQSVMLELLEIRYEVRFVTDYYSSLA